METHGDDDDVYLYANKELDLLALDWGSVAVELAHRAPVDEAEEECEGYQKHHGALTAVHGSIS